MDATFPPPPRLLLMKSTLPPPGGGVAGRIMRGWTGDLRLLTLLPGPRGRRGGTASLASSTLSLTSLSPSSSSSSSSPPPQLALCLLTPAAPQLPSPPQPQPVDANQIELPCPVCDDAQSHHRPHHHLPQCTARCSCHGNRRPPAHGGSGDVLCASSHVEVNASNSTQVVI